MFDLDRSEGSVKQSLERKHEGACADQEKICKDKEACVRLREVYGGAVEIGPFVEGLEQACCRRRRGGASVVGDAHCAGVVVVVSSEKVSKRVR